MVAMENVDISQFPVFQHAPVIKQLRRIRWDAVTNLRAAVGDEDTEDALLGQVIALHMSVAFLFPDVPLQKQGEFRRCLGQLPEIMTQLNVGGGAFKEGATAASMDLIATLDYLTS